MKVSTKRLNRFNGSICELFEIVEGTTKEGWPDDHVLMYVQDPLLSEAKRTLDISLREFIKFKTEEGEPIFTCHPTKDIAEFPDKFIMIDANKRIIRIINN